MATNEKWKTRKWRASMTDMTESTAHVVDKATGKPYSAKVSFYERDNGKREYTIIIQFLEPDEVMGTWMTRTGFHDQGEYKDPKTVMAKAKNALGKIVKDGSPITYDDYFDWREKHPIMKHRRLASDYGIYITSADKSNKGWFDRRYGTIVQTNKYATRYPTKEAAQEEASKLSRNNTGFTFTVKQMGKLDNRWRNRHGNEQ